MPEKTIHLTWNSWHPLNRAETFLSVFFNLDALMTDPHDHDYYELFIVLNGAVGHRINGEEQLLTEGDAMFIRPADRHCYFPVPVAETCCFVNIEISAGMMEELVHSMGGTEVFHSLFAAPLPPILSLSEMRRKYLDRFLLGGGVLSRDETILDVHIRGQLCLVLSWYAEFFRQNKRADIPPWFDELCREMKKPENFSAGIGRMMEISGKSHGYLCYCFRQYCDMRPVDYLNGVRLDYCAYMLCHTNRDILDMLYSVGYDSPSNFYHLFQKRYHTSPAKYRKRHRSVEQPPPSELPSDSGALWHDTEKGEKNKT